ncbi:glycosyltransferase [Devosia chinhatensis]|uniref:Glycosyltransferase n=1 Tax=Devosia aurantiaca TaxID=2714858 RepID=A0A6M1SNT1_9HYPH|nr:glycosyltransferase [Devosia aurantiaca]
MDGDHALAHRNALCRLNGAGAAKLQAHARRGQRPCPIFCAGAAARRGQYGRPAESASGSARLSTRKARNHLRGREPLARNHRCRGTALGRCAHEPRRRARCTAAHQAQGLGLCAPLCRGEFVVVYDAEDRPDPKQLRSVAAQFRRSPEVECIQARLCIDNADQGPLPALFAGEYAGLFAVLLPAFARWGTVMPLGGTSNHFRLETLRRLGGWDAYNVTEDADLGVRLARRNLRTATSVSVTLEEAPVRFKPWLGQRTRWMKGWMQTFVVHNRRARRLYADLGPAGFAMFQVTILSMLLAPILHLGMFPMLVWMQFDQSNSFDSWNPWWLACLLVLVLGHGTAMVVNMVGLARIGRNRFWAQQLLLPLYWLLITWATLLALREFLFRPFHWFKTPHLASKRRRLGGFRRPAAAE